MEDDKKADASEKSHDSVGSAGPRENVKDQQGGAAAGDAGSKASAQLADNLKNKAGERAGTGADDNVAAANVSTAATADASGAPQKKAGASAAAAKTAIVDSSSGVVASVEYVRGQRHAVIAPEKISGYKRDADHLLWTGLKDPSDEELRMTCKNLSFSKLATKEIVKRHYRPKVIDYGDYILIVAVTISRENKKIVYGEMQMIFGQSFILTVRRGEAMTNTPLRKRLEGSPELIARGSDFVVAEILDGLADSYLMLAGSFEVDVEQLEQKMILHGFRESDVRKLYKMRRDLLRVHTSIAPVIEICTRMSVVNLAFVEQDSQGYYRIVADRVARIDDQMNALRESLAFAFEASQMIAQAHQTDITKKLASWAAILAVPTAIAGIYGMNFTNMPELNWAYGYPLIMLLMFLICGLLFRQFRKTGWL